MPTIATGDTKIAEISREIENLINVVSRIEGSVSTLKARLETVMCSGVPTPESEKKAEGTDTPLGGEISLIAGRLVVVLDHLMDIDRRLGV
jgi:hypothetical protein